MMDLNGQCSLKDSGIEFEACSEGCNHNQNSSQCSENSEDSCDSTGPIIMKAGGGKKLKKMLSKEQELYLDLQEIAKEELLESEQNSQLNDSTASSTFDDKEFDFLRVNSPIRRSTSLKPYRQQGNSSSEPVSPGSRKTVRFADAMGLDLTSVKQITNPDEPPILPDSVVKTLERDCRLDFEQQEEVAFWRLRFAQPISACPDFIRKVTERKVALESCSVNNRDLKVHGVIRVSNVAFEKFVAVRYTINGWLTFNDVLARYVEGSHDAKSNTDRFYFYFNVPGHLGVRNRIEFAVEYSVDGQTFWDSNHGYNYTLECVHNLGYF